MEMTMPTDTELVASSLTGQKEAFASIVRRYQGMVSGVLYCMCGDLARSEDLAQETFIAAWKGLPQLRDHEQLPAWLRGIARRTALNARRREVRRPAPVHLEDDPGNPLAAGDEPVERLISREEQEVLWQALEQLPEQYREPMVLYYREEQSAAAVAAALELSEEAVRQRLSRGRGMLREQIAVIVERTLRATRPNAAFTLAVVAALPAMTTPQVAMAAVGAAAAKGSSAAKGLGMAGFLAMWIGPMIAVFIGVRAATENLRRARSPREKRFIKRWNAALAGCIVGFGVIAATMIIAVPFTSSLTAMTAPICTRP